MTFNRYALVMLAGTFVIGLAGYLLFSQPDASQQLPEQAKTARQVGDEMKPKDGNNVVGAKVISPVEGPSAEHAAPWRELLHFETESELEKRLEKADPFDTVSQIPVLLRAADNGDSGAALRLVELARFCKEQTPRQQLNSTQDRYQSLDCSVASQWSEEQRDAWLVTAARGGEPRAGMLALDRSRAMAASDPRRASLAQATIVGLEGAVRRGSLESAVTLSSLYGSGNFVGQDLRKALAYAQVAAVASAEDAYAGQARAWRSQLRGPDLADVRDLQKALEAAILEQRAKAASR